MGPGRLPPALLCPQVLQPNQICAAPSLGPRPQIFLVSQATWAWPLCSGPHSLALIPPHSCSSHPGPWRSSTGDAGPCLAQPVEGTQPPPCDPKALCLT